MDLEAIKVAVAIKEIAENPIGHKVKLLFKREVAAQSIRAAIKRLDYKCDGYFFRVNKLNNNEFTIQSVSKDGIKNRIEATNLKSFTYYNYSLDLYSSIVVCENFHEFFSRDSNLMYYLRKNNLIDSSIKGCRPCSFKREESQNGRKERKVYFISKE